MPHASPTFTWRSVAALALLGLASAFATAAPAVATAENQTRPTACAEEDNVSLVLSGAGITRMQVEALQPPYLAAIEKDITAPDFSNCNFDGGAHPTDPAFKFKPRRVVLHDDARWTIVGITLPTFWRPNRVPVRVGARSGNDFHLLQVFAKTATKPLEAIVIYPADGYWRIKPLPQPRFGDGVYGSSFLLGPVVDDGRPVVNISAITVQTAPLAIRLAFAGGGHANVKVAEISEARTALDVAFSRPTRRNQPFAVLRSMYVTPANADMSEVEWRATRDAATTQTKPLPEFTRTEAAELRFGRSLPSRHNTSAPDIRFSGFETAAPGR
jgi:hypothetical protein